MFPLGRRSLDPNSFPSCTIDFPLEFSAEELASASSPVNLLLKCNYLLGTLVDFKDVIQSLFDIAFEISQLACCACISGSPETNDTELVAGRHLPFVDLSNDESLILPVALSKLFNKGIFLDAGKNTEFDAACRAWGVASILAFPIRRNTEFTGALVFGKGRATAFDRLEMKLLWTLASNAENLYQQRNEVTVPSYFSFLDPLTHLYNRRYFEALLTKEIDRSRRNGRSIALLRLALDGIGSYDEGPHSEAGNIALQEVAVIIKNSVRRTDTVSRIGGNDFAVILTESGSAGGKEAGKRINDGLKRHLHPDKRNTQTDLFSVNIGIASFPGDACDNQDLIKKAEHALYNARGSRGSGKVCLHHEISSPLSKASVTLEIPD